MTQLREKLIRLIIGQNGQKIRQELQNQFAAKVEQQMDFESTYISAQKLKRRFSSEMSRLASQLPEHRVEVRPNLIKKKERAWEKFQASEVVPLDILAAKIVVKDLAAMYKVAEKLRNLLNIAYFKDRLERTQSNGYGDLQFNAWFEGQVVEVKISHEHMDYMDTREHPVYEIVRSLNENPKELTLAERTLSDGLKEVSTQTYSVVWEQILFNEVVL